MDSNELMAGVLMPVALTGGTALDSNDLMAGVLIPLVLTGATALLYWLHALAR